MSHLEHLIAEYLDWKGYIVKRNLKVGARAKGGWEMELDIVAYQPHTNDLIHCEPSLDAHAWEKRRSRYKKKFDAGRKRILSEVFTWLKPETPIRQIAIFPTATKEPFEGATVLSVDQMTGIIRDDVMQCGVMAKKAISEFYPLLRTLQLSHCGYNKVSQAKMKLFN